MLELNKIYNADCLELMKEITDKSIDLILTDPPYILTNGGNGKSCLKSIQKISNGLINIENGFDIEITLIEFKRICKKFNAFIFCSNKQVSTLMKWGEERDYYTTLLVWHKYNCTPFCNGVWSPDIEFIVHIREKGATFQGNAKLKNKVVTLPIEVSKYGHPTEKPLGLIERYLKIGSNENDLILDCFSGSGTTAIACHNLKRNFICIEKDKDYHEASVKRLNQCKQQLKLF